MEPQFPAGELRADMAAVSSARKQAKKLRLFSFWVEEDNTLGSPWLRRAWARADSKKKLRTDLDCFLQEVSQTGVYPEGTTLANCEMSGGNDISLIYPWVHLSSGLGDITSWLKREEQRRTNPLMYPPDLRQHQPSQYTSSMTGSLDRRSGSIPGKRTLVQGTYCIVESVLPSQDIRVQGEQLCVLLGFRTTDDNCVDTVEADSERSQEARSWREWTGIGTLYKNLAKEQTVEVVQVDFMESHVPDHTAVFHYLVLLYLQVNSERGKVGVLDVVARFRVRNMSGYVTVYSNLTKGVGVGSTVSLGDQLRRGREEKREARQEFLKSS